MSDWQHFVCLLAHLQVIARFRPNRVQSLPVSEQPFRSRISSLANVLSRPRRNMAKYVLTARSPRA
jgi:hypothetical protein